MFYHRRPDAPLPHDRTFIVNLDDGTSLRVWASSQLVTIHHHRRLHQEPLWRATFLLADNPGLAALYTPRMGWDLVGLISLMRSEIEHMAQLNLREIDVRKELGIDTVTIPYQHREKQEKRPMGQALEMITAFVGEHPGCTRLQIASGIDRAKQPNVIVQIEWLVGRGYLARSHGTSAQGRLEFRYTLIEPFIDNGD
jgi:hypothetical protein